MSPSETPHLTQKRPSTDTEFVSLEDYAVTSNGFLPDEPPLERLPHPYYAPWESLMACLSTSLAEQTLRTKVNQLPVLSTDHLSTEPEWRRACVILGFLAHAYIWGGDTAAEILPPPITTPLLTVTSHLGIPPVASYACLNLWNFRTTPPSLDLTDLDALTALHTFTGTQDESWFYMVSVAMEAKGAYIIPVMLSALHAAHTLPHFPTPNQTYDIIVDALHQLTACIRQLGGLLDRMDDNCTPQTFYHRIRPFLAGSKNMTSAGLPRGVFYDEGEGKGEWRQLRGGSNGQSSLIQFLDVVLGVEHGVGGKGSTNPDGPGVKGGDMQKNGEVGFHKEVRGYMPEPHRRFLEDVERKYPGGMRTGVQRVLAVAEGADGVLSRDQMEVQEAFETTTRALGDFRHKHLQMVTRYIVIPSRQPNGSQGVNLAAASSKLKSLPGTERTAGAELTGTGGTALLPFLKQSRDDTFQAGRLRVQ